MAATMPIPDSGCTRQRRWQRRKRRMILQTLRAERRPAPWPARAGSSAVRLPSQLVLVATSHSLHRVLQPGFLLQELTKSWIVTEAVQVRVGGGNGFSVAAGKRFP